MPTARLIARSSELLYWSKVWVQDRRDTAHPGGSLKPADHTRAVETSKRLVFLTLYGRKGEAPKDIARLLTARAESGGSASVRDVLMPELACGPVK
jgi:hypothetical protein